VFSLPGRSKSWRGAPSFRLQARLPRVVSGGVAENKELMSDLSSEDGACSLSVLTLMVAILG
jgi:hypothetical protein